MNDFNFLKNKIEQSTMKYGLIDSNTGDGRLDSALSEGLVVTHLQELFANEDITITTSSIRKWYDVLINYNGVQYPINIKITNGNSADNVGSKLGLYYTLTGIWPEDVQGINNNWMRYNESLIQNLNIYNDADYYFIIYFKETNHFFFTSLKRIDKLVSNGNNLPYQCNWKQNQYYTERKPEEQSQYLMNMYYDSWVKKTGGFAPLLKWKEEISNE